MLLAHETQEEAISIHAPRTGSDKTFTRWGCFWRTFQSTLPARGATPVLSAGRSLAANFNPRSPHGERLSGRGLARLAGLFQSTLPARGATFIVGFAVNRAEFQSTLPARGATRLPRGCFCRHRLFQSTLPARGATRWASLSVGVSVFQSTLPARGATFQRPLNRIQTCLFQSTLPARGATIFTPPISTPKLNFNPRSPHGERLEFIMFIASDSTISIHAPRTGSDAVEQRTNLGAGYFNPRSPHGERHDFRHSPERAEAISIHAPRTGSDERCDCGCSQTDISIHAPRTGSDRTLRNLVNIVNSFQSTLPARGATRYHFFRRLSNVISIHAPRTGSDL